MAIPLNTLRESPSSTFILVSASLHLGEVCHPPLSQMYLTFPWFEFSIHLIFSNCNPEFHELTNFFPYRKNFYGNLHNISFANVLLVLLMIVKCGIHEYWI